MLQRVVASFIVRIIHEPGNEQIPWNITVQHLQTHRVYRLADLKGIDSLLGDAIKAEIGPAENSRVIPLGRENPE